MSEDINVGAISEALNNKMDRDGVNASCPVVISRTPNSQGGVVEIWSDGYCVQTGTVNSASGDAYTITLEQSYMDSNYVVLKTMITNSTSSGIIYNQVSIFNKTINSFQTSTAGVGFSWRTEGYIR